MPKNIEQKQKYTLLDDYLARSLYDLDKSVRRNQSLKNHLMETSEIACSFGNKCGIGETMRLAGFWHDLGKSSEEWQEYLHRNLHSSNPQKERLPHSEYGAKYAYDKTLLIPPFAEILANIIASHHGRLYDNISPDGETSLNDKIARTENVDFNGEPVDINALKNELLNITQTAENLSLDRFFFVSMLTKLAFSCLVDADRLGAYLFEIGVPYSHPATPNWGELINALEKRLAEFSETDSNSAMSKLRRKVSEDCKIAGLRGVGIYKLEVPTGGGKTLSSLRFALEHAKHHGLDRVIYVIPYLSILSQTAIEIRRTLGCHEDMVFEHHSDFFPDDDKEEHYKLQMGRWDAPIILTTQVQLLESIFSAKGSDLRKLHNMAKSVIIFDEAQSIPLKCTHIFNSAMNFINKICKSTILLCTATQPPFERVFRKILFSDSPSLTTYIEPPKRYNIINSLSGAGYTYPELSEFILDKHNNSTLVIVNTKAAAKAVYEELKEINSVLHLSTNMCSAHRDDVIAKLRQRLKNKESVICVSTQLIEAGVDISFECVIRDIAGLDSIFQAAGRCNRHGEYDDAKSVYVINIKGENLSRLPDIKAGANITRRLFDEENVTIEQYYEYYYGQTDIKNKMDYPVNNGSIYDLLSCNKQGVGAYKNRGNKTKIALPFAMRSAADEFYVIEKGRINVIVPYGDSEALLNQYNSTDCLKEKRQLLKKLGKYSVSLYEEQLKKFKKHGAIDNINYNGLTVLSKGFYSGDFGIDINGKHELLNA
ncbi:MAG: CRISPR-associated helicase Cas3' [Oscillospiraceae bacterium]|nr:CRISPR-associated helicase Cas3' [Oscillospiraceae bacterium]